MTLTAEEYQRQLDAAGYGAMARQRYIKEAADPEYAECQWEEMIIPAAEAAGKIPEAPDGGFTDSPTTPETEPSRQDPNDPWASRYSAQELRAQQQAMDEWWDRQDPDLTPWNLTAEQDKEGQDFIASRTKELLAQLEPAPEPDAGEPEIDI